MEYGNPPDYKKFSRQAFWLSLLIVASVIGFIWWFVDSPREVAPVAPRSIPEQPEIPRPPVPENVAEGKG